MIRFPCPSCGNKLAAPEEKVGVATICRYCRVPIIVPATILIDESMQSPAPDPVNRLADQASKIQARFSPQFLSDLKAVYDAQVEHDPDENVPVLARILETRRETLREKWHNYLKELRQVYELEGGRDPEQDIPQLGSRLDEWRAHNVLQLREYLSAIPEDDPLRCPISLFGTLGLGRIETAHTNALAWLLNPTEQHGLDSCLLDALLVHVAKSTGYRNVFIDGVKPEQRLVVSRKLLGRLDVFASGTWIASDGVAGGWALAIEAKIDAEEGDNWLGRYDEWLNANYSNCEVFRIFLTPDGRRPEAEVSDWFPMSFLDLVRVFRGPYSQLKDKPGFQFLRFYLTGVLKEICRWRIPVDVPETCDDPYGVVTYLKTVQHSS